MTKAAAIEVVHTGIGTMHVGPPYSGCDEAKHYRSSIFCKFVTRVNSQPMGLPMSNVSMQLGSASHVIEPFSDPFIQRLRCSATVLRQHSH